jgi:hypothetical protein
MFDNQYIVVHNGVVSNSYSLETEHKKLGIKYVSRQENGKFNDSEALAYDIALYLEGKQPNLKAQGSIAFIAVRRNKDGKPMQLFFGRNGGNPLKMKHTDHSLTLSSEGEGELVPDNKLHWFNYDTKELYSRDLEIPRGYSNFRSSYNPHGSRQPALPSRTTSHLTRPYDQESLTKTIQSQLDSTTSVQGTGDTGSHGFDDEAAYDQYWEDRSEVKSLKDRFLNYTSYNYRMAIGLAKGRLKVLESRLASFDDLEEELETASEDENSKAAREMAKVIDQMDILDIVIMELRNDGKYFLDNDDIEDIEELEESATQQMGFHYPTEEAINLNDDPLFKARSAIKVTTRDN